MKTIIVKNIGKKYIIDRNINSFPTIRDRILNIKIGLKKELAEEFWALKKISFEINEGDIVGIVGNNGSGKSTLLKILSRIVEPTEGKALLVGRVSSLLEIGTGFNPELSGRENIFLNGSILGMKKNEIEKKFEKIVEFSGIREFLEMPIKKYSSGMTVRLAFSVAAHLDSDILLVDEVLAVGDAEFQNKCLGKMGNLARDGKTVIYVSHNLESIKTLCNWAILLQKGRLVLKGKVKEVINKYLAI